MIFVPRITHSLNTCPLRATGYGLKTPYREGTTHIVMSPLEFMQRLAALVPRPKLHLIASSARQTGPPSAPASLRLALVRAPGPGFRFHGVLAPNARLRAEIIPSSGRQAGTVPVPGFPSAPVNANASSADHGDASHSSAPARISWTRLLKRVFDIDVEHCPQCGGPLKIIAAIEDPHPDRQDPFPSRLARPGTAPITGAGIRSIPNSLIPNRSTLPSGLAPEPTSPFSAQPPETPKRLETSHFGSMHHPKVPRFWTEDFECLTSFRFSSTSPFEEKGRLISYTP
ncbi:MAG: hypothetical protein ACREYF_16335, partial [Gammaproteobacteria bacterium]